MIASSATSGISQMFLFICMSCQMCFLKLQAVLRLCRFNHDFHLQWLLRLSRIQAPVQSAEERGEAAPPARTRDITQVAGVSLL